MTFDNVMIENKFSKISFILKEINCLLKQKPASDQTTSKNVQQAITHLSAFFSVTFSFFC